MTKAELIAAIAAKADLNKAAAERALNAILAAVQDTLTREGKTVRYRGEELLAKAICHECDHLDGILYVEKVIRFIETEED